MKNARCYGTASEVAEAMLKYIKGLSKSNVIKDIKIVSDTEVTFTRIDDGTKFAIHPSRVNDKEFGLYEFFFNNWDWCADHRVYALYKRLYAEYQTRKINPYSDSLKGILNKYGFTDVDYSNAKPIKFTATSLGNLFQDISNLQDALGKEILEEIHRTGCYEDLKYDFR